MIRARPQTPSVPAQVRFRPFSFSHRSCRGGCTSGRRLRAGGRQDLDGRVFPEPSSSSGTHQGLGPEGRRQPGRVQYCVWRELFYGIQQGGRIDPKTGRLIKADDTKNVTENVTDDNLRELTERQRVIIGILPFDDTEDVTETTSTLAQKTGVSRRTIARDMDVLKEKGFVIRIGPSNGGYWKRLK